MLPCADLIKAPHIKQRPGLTVREAFIANALWRLKPGIGIVSLPRLALNTCDAVCLACSHPLPKRVKGRKTARIPPSGGTANCTCETLHETLQRHPDPNRAWKAARMGARGVLSAIERITVSTRARNGMCG